MESFITVLWNPGQNLIDQHQLGDGQKEVFREFLCVEPGHVFQPVVLGRGGEWHAGQTIRIL